MVFKLPESREIKARLQRVLRPKSKLGRTTLWFGGLALVLELLRLIFRAPNGTMLSGWASFLVFIFAVCATLMCLRWVRRQFMWRLRNRLIVTYVFIGVIPIFLLMTMAILAGYLFGGQFATYVAMSDLQSELQHLESANRSLAMQFRSLARSGKLNEQLAAEIASASDENFRNRVVSVWDGDRPFVLAAGRPAPGVEPVRESAAIQGDFAGFVLDGKRLHLRVVKHVEAGSHRLTVISNVPVTPQLLRMATSQLGSVTVIPPDEDKKTESDTPSSSSPRAPKSSSVPDKDKLIIDMGDSHATVSLSGENASSRVEAGRVPPPANSFDKHIPFATRFSAIDWHTGKSLTGLILVDTRPSMLYATLFSALGDKAEIFLDVLVGIAIFFGVIELIALFIGMRISRSITKSVADLYVATQHVNRGDLAHRIKVRTHDQMAALEQSFNSMTQSLSNLMSEQKEKQRLESELAIAHEVQDLLFPADLSGLATLEVHGVCRPARTVSGDYYDFIPLHEDKLVLAVGDISGKGISAALLMATVHAFVRAYSLEPERTLASVALDAGLPRDSALALPMYYRGDGTSDSQLAPGLLMATLNYQLYRSTPPEKYATMFLGCYDAASRSLTYSNAGHLPPLVLGHNG
ncbi:MAG TPA: SpoIIE family protein phosphatase, partial [Candidatus Limnocylindrales bacterium]|nr:SpoIIE family protein phosphatase [Candidatus Limnocylindrales bacterium]